MVGGCKRVNLTVSILNGEGIKTSPFVHKKGAFGVLHKTAVLLLCTLYTRVKIIAYPYRIFYKKVLTRLHFCSIIESKNRILSPALGFVHKGWHPRVVGIYLVCSRGLVKRFPEPQEIAGRVLTEKMQKKS